jgi:DNA primase
MLNPKREKPARLDIEAIKREHTVTAAAAAAGLKLLRAGSDYKACCPFHADRSPSFTIFAGGKRWCCFGCGEQGDVLDFVSRMHTVGLREAAALLTGGEVPRWNLPEPVADKADNTPAARAIWDAAEPISGTLAESYLRSRCLHLPLPDSLRFAALPYGTRGRTHPVMVAAIVDVAGDLTGIQRTYLNGDGTGKLAVDKPKLSLGRVSGGAVRLAPTAGSLVVTEGIEDALTLQQELGFATWAAAGAGMLHKMQFPPEVYSVSVGGDRDQAGRASAHRAVTAFRCLGIGASAFFPTIAKDFNAELAEIRR